jgi:hypothetical protein
MLNIMLATADDKMVMFERATATIVLNWPMMRSAGTTRTPMGRVTGDKKVISNGVLVATVPWELVKGHKVAEG